MENSSNNLAEELAYEIQFDNLDTDFSATTFGHAGPGDEEDEEEEVEGEPEGNEDDNPPIDEEVVHSPVTPQTGGRPKATIN